MDQDLIARVERLEDIEAARALLHRYAEALDEPDAATVSRLFAEDAVLRTPVGDFEGVEDIQKFFESAFESDPSVKRHFIVTPKVVDVSDHVVRMQSYFLFVGRAEGASTIGWGTYDDEIDVGGDVPLLRAKTIDVHLGTDLATGWALEGDR